MKTILIPVFVLFTIAGFSQTNTLYANIIKAETLQKHLTIIAGEEMQGRETGTEGQRKAAAYIEAQFKKIGLAYPASMNSYQQEYPLHKDSLLKAEIKIEDYKAAFGKDYVINLNNNNSAKIKADGFVFAGYGIDDKNYSDYTSLNVKGKVVIIFSGEPKLNGKYIISNNNKSSDWTYPGISKKVETAAKKGAAAVLVISPLMEIFGAKMIENSKKTNVYYPREKPAKATLWNAAISHVFARQILGVKSDSLISIAKQAKPFNNYNYFSKKSKIKIEYAKSTSTITASNVLGVIEGSDKKDEYVFITGHYDHLGIRDGKIYYGADDDGSGTCAVINMAEAFAKAKAEGNGPRRTIVFMTVSGEEKGLWGSEYYSDHPIYPLEKTTVDLNIDMIGRIDTERKLDDTLNYVYVVGHDKISTELPLINEGMNKLYTNLTLDYKFDDPNDQERIYFRSDHYNFARKGVPVLFFYDGMLKADYHKPTDTVDKITWALYEKRARMIFYTAWEMANRDLMLSRDLPVPRDVR